MKKFYSLILALILCPILVLAQEEEKQEAKTGHYNINKFRQLYDEFATPNMYRTGSGAPGPGYYQQQADYKMDLVLDDANARLDGVETITYHNNSPDQLKFLWVQLDQNMRSKDSKSPLIQGNRARDLQTTAGFIRSYVNEPFDGGFNIESVTDTNGKSLKYMINQTMMRVELPTPMNKGDKFSFKIKWWYNINNHVQDGGRSGFEYFPESDNRIYVMAQFYPRMAVYNDVEGWQNSQFWGRDEFALPFGNFEVNITVPADHVLDGTGRLMNRDKVYSKEMLKRYKQAQKTYDKPVMIVNQEEAEKAALSKSTGTKTWKLYAENVRDFGWASSRMLIQDMMAVKIGGKDVMAVSMYPPAANPLWGNWSTYTVASTLKTYSRLTFDYPYHKAISVNAPMGMEYPMICYNFGRPRPDGTIPDRTKYGMMGVIIHEVGHNFFPMIVNSDERQWTWMDEGLNTFLEYIASLEFGESYPDALSEGDDVFPVRSGPAKNIVPYMSSSQDFIAPIMSKGLNTYQFGNNAYSKPATGLNILRETVMGRELFDYAFKEYANRWKFKHPTPEDFFRTMEDASAMDLDWFWRGWFYSTDWTDIGVKEVKTFYVIDAPKDIVAERAKRFGMNPEDFPPVVYLADGSAEGFDKTILDRTALENAPTLNEYMMDNFTEEERAKAKVPKYLYQVTFDKPGGLVMPIIAEYTYEDGTKERIQYPAEIWRFNDNEVRKTIASDKQIVSVEVDPDEETADIDTSNNNWPKKVQQSKFDEFQNRDR
ncbi:MAG: M1 family metallopeptidase [Bacteroidota bacterium]